VFTLSQRQAGNSLQGLNQRRAGRLGITTDPRHHSSQDLPWFALHTENTHRQLDRGALVCSVLCCPGSPGSGALRGTWSYELCLTANMAASHCKQHLPETASAGTAPKREICLLDGLPRSPRAIYALGMPNSAYPAAAAARISPRTSAAPCLPQGSPQKSCSSWPGQAGTCSCPHGISSSTGGCRQQQQQQAQQPCSSQLHSLHQCCQ
jgi:hypothetical protein